MGSSLIERLRAAGADMDSAMDRLCGDEELYASCLAYFLSDPTFDALGAALDAGNYAAAFESAHALKGVAGNLGLTKCYQLCGALVEPLRGGAPDGADLAGACRALLEYREALRAMAQA